MATRLHPILWFRRHPRVADALLAVVIAVLAITVIATNTADDTPSGLRIPRSTDVFGVGLVAVGALSLTWRRVKPLPVLVVSLALLILRERLNYPSGGDSLAPIIAGYTVAVTTEARRRLAWIAGSVLAVVTFFTLFDLGAITTENLVGSLVSNVVVLGTAFLLATTCDSVARDWSICSTATRSLSASKVCLLIAPSSPNAPASPVSCTTSSRTPSA